MTETTDQATEPTEEQAAAPAEEQAAAPAEESTEAAAPAEDSAQAAEAPEEGADEGAAEGEGEGNEDAEVLAALGKLNDRLFERMCRAIPVRTLMLELQKVDRAVYFRYFKGHRPNKIDAKRLAKVLRKELFERNNGLLAQLVVYNWDEHQWRLFGALQKHIKAINEDVEAIEAITDAEADPIFDDLEQARDSRGRQLYDRRDIAIGCIINGVRVSPEYVQNRWGDLLS